MLLRRFENIFFRFRIIELFERKSRKSLISWNSAKVDRARTLAAVLATLIACGRDFKFSRTLKRLLGLSLQPTRACLLISSYDYLVDTACHFSDTICQLFLVQSHLFFSFLLASLRHLPPPSFFRPVQSSEDCSVLSSSVCGQFRETLVASRA